MSEAEILNEFGLKDSDSDWGEGSGNGEEDEVIIEENSSDMDEEITEIEKEGGFESDQTEESESEDAFIQEEYEMVKPEEEEAQYQKVEIIINNTDKVISFTILSSFDNFSIRASSSVTLNMVINQIQDLLQIDKNYLSLYSVDQIPKDAYDLTLDQLNIQDGFMLSLKFLFLVKYENEMKSIESADCKDLNDLYVLLLTELGLQSCQLWIDHLQVCAPQYPALALSTYFNLPVEIEVKKDIVIKLLYHNMEIPFVFKGQQEFMKMKDTVNCYKLYPMIQSVLGINYPILIFYQKRRITKSTLLPESEIAFLTHLNVYDLYIHIPNWMVIDNFSITTDTVYGKEDIVEADLDLSDGTPDTIKDFIVQCTEIVPREDNKTKLIIAYETCVLQSTSIFNEYSSFFYLYRTISPVYVNRNYYYNHTIKEDPLLNNGYEETQNQLISKSSTRQSKRNGNSPQNRNQESQKAQSKDHNSKSTSFRRPHRNNVSQHAREENQPHRDNRGNGQQPRNEEKQNNRRENKENQYQREEKQYTRRDNKEKQHSRNEENSHHGQNQKYRKPRNHNQRGGSNHRTLGGHRVRSDLY